MHRGDLSVDKDGEIPPESLCVVVITLVSFCKNLVGAMF